jgi:hypothetical protein
MYMHAYIMHMYMYMHVHACEQHGKICIICSSEIDSKEAMGLMQVEWDATGKLGTVT